jgi:branched-chain amino acid transport system permease protein
MSLSGWFPIDKPLGLFGLAISAASTVLLSLLVAVAAAVFNWASDGHYSELVLSIGIALVLTIGFQIFSGSTGVVSFGHPAFVAIGAYVAGIVSVPPEMKSTMLPDLPASLGTLQLGLVPATLLGGLVAAILALLVGPVVMRLSGAAASIMTFGFLVIVNELLRNAESFTRGNQTFFGVPKLASFGAVYGTVVLAAALAATFKFSRAGLRVRAIREDSLAAETAGIGAVAARMWPWVLSAFVMGAGGALTAFFLTAFSPQSFYVPLAIPMIIMAVLGGLGSVAGAIAGTVVLTIWQQLMQLLETGGFGFSVPLGSSQLTLGLGLILLLYWRPSGLLADREFMLGGVDRAVKSHSPDPNFASDRREGEAGNEI